MVVAAKAVSHRKFMRTKHNWSEAYTGVTASVDDGELYGWVLNRPGPNVAGHGTGSGTEIAPNFFTERPVYSTAGNWGDQHQPYLFDQISADYSEYRVYGVKYKLTVSNTHDSDEDRDIYVAVGVTQELHEDPASASTHSFTTNHIDNQPEYIEGRHPEWRRKTLHQGKSATFEGYINVRKFLKKPAYNNTNEQLEVFPWYEVPDTGNPSYSLVIGTEGQEQPYWGWGPTLTTPAGTVRISNITENGPADANWVTATYARAPQACFLYLNVVTDNAGLPPTYKVSLSCVQYIEWKRRDPVYTQS